MDGLTDGVHLLDCREGLAALPDESVDLILTDPPYGVKYKGIANDDTAEFFLEMIPEFYRILKPKSFFIFFYSIQHMVKLFHRFPPFEYFWTCVVLTPINRGHTVVGFPSYQFMPIFKKGDAKIRQKYRDVFEVNNTRLIEPEEGYIPHPTVKHKGVITKLLEMFSDPGNLVLDPFAGSGTTGVGCRLTGRRFLGFEINPAYHQVAVQRIAGVTEISGQERLQF